MDVPLMCDKNMLQDRYDIRDQAGIATRACSHTFMREERQYKWECEMSDVNAKTGVCLSLIRSTPCVIQNVCVCWSMYDLRRTKKIKRKTVRV